MLDSLRYACSSSDSCSTTLRTARKSLKCSSRRGRVNQESGSWLRPPNLTLRASKLLGIGNEEKKRKKPIFISPCSLPSSASFSPSLSSIFPSHTSRPSRKVRITQGADGRTRADADADRLRSTNARRASHAKSLYWFSKGVRASPSGVVRPSAFLGLWRP